MGHFNKLFGPALLLSTLFLYAAVEQKPSKPNPSDIQVVPVNRSPEANDISLRLQYPDNASVENKQPIRVEMRLDWFPLGVDTETRRSREIYSPSEGQSIHVFIDNQPFFEITESLFDALDDHDTFFNQATQFEVPFKLIPGAHIIRAFPCRSYGESLKGPKAYVASVFYVDEKGTPEMDLSEPFLTYNMPQGRYPADDKPILLDFYVNNCHLSKDGYKIRMTVDGAQQRFLYSWSPYYIYGLTSGKHDIMLELLSPQNTPVPGEFNKVERTFFID